MKSNGYLVTVTEVKTLVSAKAPISDSSYCVIKDSTGGYTCTGVVNNFYVNESVTPFSTYANNREPRYQDVVPICPSCAFGVSVGNTVNCSAGYATKYITISSSCGSYELRLEAIGNGAVSTAWQYGCCSGGPYIYTFNSVPVGTYRVQIRPVIPVGTCTSQYSSNFNICCDSNASWVNNGAVFCGSTGNCTLYQPQIDANFCSSTYNQTRNVSLGPNDGCGTWSGQTQYCANYGVYPFELRTHEVNSCTGNGRNDSLVATLSPTCGYTCAYWGLSASLASQFCNASTNGSGMVVINASSANGSYQLRLYSMGIGVTTAWQSGSTFTGVYDGQYIIQIRSVEDNNCIVQTGYPYIIVACQINTTTTTIPATTTTTTTAGPVVYGYYNIYFDGTGPTPLCNSTASTVKGLFWITNPTLTVGAQVWNDYARTISATAGWYGQQGAGSTWYYVQGGAVNGIGACTTTTTTTATPTTTTTTTLPATTTTTTTLPNNVQWSTLGSAGGTGTLQIKRASDGFVVFSQTSITGSQSSTLLLSVGTTYTVSGFFTSGSSNIVRLRVCDSVTGELGYSGNITAAVGSWSINITPTSTTNIYYMNLTSGSTNTPALCPL